MTDVKEFYKENYKTIKDLSVRHIELVDHAAKQGIGLDKVKKMVDITPSVRENDFDELVTRDVEGARELFGDVRVEKNRDFGIEYAVINKSQPKHTKYLASDGKVYLVSHDVAEVGDRVIVRAARTVRKVRERDEDHDIWTDRPVELFDSASGPYDEEYFTKDEYLKIVREVDRMVIQEEGDRTTVKSEKSGTAFRGADGYKLVKNASGNYPNLGFYKGQYHGWLLVKPYDLFAASYDSSRTSKRGDVVGLLSTAGTCVLDIGTLHHTKGDEYMFINHRNGAINTLNATDIEKEVVEILFVTRNENIPRMAIFGGEW